ncbi:DUF962 domain-containing protein [Thalassotalea crassostreae]|uniref:DUF962 domain-containing protein n=1 Tax=Thalassotalea crassostreae TaxID=1763536 RepID=UPI0008386CBD|nr:DUF962 domain-containing protein [Thalassotalea crassostreae]
MTTKRYNSFAEFYPFYLSQHQDPTCRLLHYLGSTTALVILLYAIFSGQLKMLWLPLVIGYGFAWVGHFVYEKNRPATFQYPLYSFIGDWVMFKDFLLGKKF